MFSALLWAAVCSVVVGSGGAAFAQTTTDIWTATLTVGSSSTDATLLGWSRDADQFDNDDLTDTDFQYAGDNWRLYDLTLSSMDSKLLLDFIRPQTSPSVLTSLVLHIGSATFSLGSADKKNYPDALFYWVNTGLSWSAGDTFVVKLAETSLPELSSDNAAPVFAADSTTRRMAENSPAGADVGSPVAATDADGDSLTYALDGPDAASFDIVAATGQLRTKLDVTYDHETQPSHSVAVKADDGRGGSDTITVTIDVTDVDESPLAPETPAVAPVPDTADSLAASWTAPANDGRPAIDGYDLQYRRRADAGVWIDGPQDLAATAGTIAGLAPDTAYAVRVRAYNDEGDGPWSPAGTGQTAPLPVPALPGASVIGLGLLLLGLGRHQLPLPRHFRVRNVLPRVVCRGPALPFRGVHGECAALEHQTVDREAFRRGQRA